jgi:hypothetical protein
MTRLTVIINSGCMSTQHKPRYNTHASSTIYDNALRVDMTIHGSLNFDEGLALKLRD